MDERHSSDEQSYLKLLEQGWVGVPFCDWRDRTPEWDPATAAWVEQLRRWADADGIGLNVFTLCNISWGDTLVELAQHDGNPYLEREHIDHWLRKRPWVLRRIEADYGPALAAARARARSRLVAAATGGQDG